MKLIKDLRNLFPDKLTGETWYACAEMSWAGDIAMDSDTYGEQDEDPSDYDMEQYFKEARGQQEVNINFFRHTIGTAIVDSMGDNASGDELYAYDIFHNIKLFSTLEELLEYTANPDLSVYEEWMLPQFEACRAEAMESWL